MFYLFGPLLDKEGKQVVRELENLNEWYEDEEVPCQAEWDSNRETIWPYNDWPILTLQKFEDDPFKGIRGVYEKWLSKTNMGEENNALDNPYNDMKEEMWQAIVKTMEKLEVIHDRRG